MNKRNYAGFTLIELLIVVAIIAILAAIAVPNFLEAQVRAKVSRGKNDMRTMATALEAYKIDANHYPDDNWTNWPNSQGYPYTLTSPVAYITSLPRDVFRNRQTNLVNTDLATLYHYMSEGFIRVMGDGVPAGTPADVWARRADHQWVLASVGPDQRRNGENMYLYGEEVLNYAPANPALNYGPGCLYDPTNGTVSAGDIMRVGP